MMPTPALTRTAQPSRRLLLRLLGGTALLPLAACGVLTPYTTPLDQYTLSPKTTFQNPPPKVDWQLVVEKPIAAAGIDTARIALSRNPYQVEYFAKAVWTDNAPSMVQTLMIDSFQNSKAIVGVGREAIGLRPDYLLKTDLREFQANYHGSDPAPDVRVKMIARLVKLPERRIIASMTADRVTHAAGPKITDVIDAFDESLGGVIKQIVIFTLRAPSGNLDGLEGVEKFPSSESDTPSSTGDTTILTP
jgi:cholesterol transport system auxiliary component